MQSPLSLQRLPDLVGQRQGKVALNRLDASEKAKLKERFPHYNTRPLNVFLVW
jgi:hypothetical protein